MNNLIFMISCLIILMGVFVIGFLIGHHSKEKEFKRNETIITAKKGDMIFIPENCDIIGIALYRPTDSTNICIVDQYSIKKQPSSRHQE